MSNCDPPPELTDRSSNNMTKWLIFAVLAVAAVARFYGLSDKPLWTDELYSWWIIVRLGMSDLLTLTLGSAEPHPPLYHLLLRGIVSIAGETECIFRIPSAVASVLILVWTAIILFGLSRDRSVNVIALSLIALSSMQIEYAQEARMYALACSMVYLAIASCHLFIRDGGKIPLIVMGIAAAYSAMTHYLAAGVFPALIFFGLLHPDFKRRHIAPLLGALAASAAIVAPWYAATSFSVPGDPLYLSSSSFQGITSSQVKEIAAGLSQHVTGMSISHVLGPAISRLINILTLACITLGFIGAGKIIVSRKQTESKRLVAILIAIVVIFFGGYAVLFVIRGFRWYARYHIFAGPALLALIAIGLGNFPRWISRPAIAALFASSLIGTFCYYHDDVLKEPWPHFIEIVKSHAGAEAPIVVTIDVALGFGYYGVGLADRIIVIPAPHTVGSLFKYGFTTNVSDSWVMPVADSVDNSKRLVIAGLGRERGYRDIFTTELRRRGWVETGNVIMDQGLGLHASTFEK